METEELEFSDIASEKVSAIQSAVKKDFIFGPLIPSYREPQIHLIEMDVSSSYPGTVMIDERGIAMEQNEFAHSQR